VEEADNNNRSIFPKISTLGDSISSPRNRLDERKNGEHRGSNMVPTLPCLLRPAHVLECDSMAYYNVPPTVPSLLSPLLYTFPPTAAMTSSFVQ
jgi:hypothetical protein